MKSKHKLLRTKGREGGRKKRRESRRGEEGGGVGKEEGGVSKREYIFYMRIDFIEMVTKPSHKRQTLSQRTKLTM